MMEIEDSNLKSQEILESHCFNDLQGLDVAMVAEMDDRPGGFHEAMVTHYDQLVGLS